VHIKDISRFVTTYSRAEPDGSDDWEEQWAVIDMHGRYVHLSRTREGAITYLLKEQSNVVEA
jgi:hypothetical protein